MPECLDCAMVCPTADMRRTTRGGEKGHICSDRPGCRRRVRLHKLNQRAENLTPRHRRRVEAAYESLSKLRVELGEAWDAAVLAPVVAAHDGLRTYIHNHREG